MLTPLKTEVLKVDDLSHEARRFRTILWSFQRNLELLFKDTGLTAKIDHAALAEAFARWRQKFDLSKHLADVNRHDYVIFAAGLMLRELIVAAPLKASKEGELPALPGDIDHPLARWPEGYAYTSFCLSVAAAILKEIGDKEPLPAPVADDPGFWNSFRENTHEDPETAVGFFDLVCGEEPNWSAPGVPWLRKAFAEHGKLVANKT